MWEAIQSNRAASRWLIGVMGGILVLLGFLIGLFFDPDLGGGIGALAALVVWLTLLATALAAGDQVLLAGARAHEIQKDDSPRLWNVIEEMAIASGMGTLPRIYLIEDDAPNAFAVGQRPDKAAIAVTSGLLARLNRDELQGVIAHEMAHIRNQDARFMTIAAVMLGAIVLISDLFFRSLWFGGGGGRRRTSRGGGQAQIVIVVLAVVAAVIAPFCAQLLYFATSRRREFFADASAARFTRYPDGLASALEKISLPARAMRDVNRAVAPLYIVNPLAGDGPVSLFSTHPPTSQRIKILRAMGGHAGYVDYEAAFRKVEGRTKACLGERTLQSEGSVPARAPTVDTEPTSASVERAKEVAEILGRLAGFIAIPCDCGVSIRIPPESRHGSITCPRCGRTHEIPEAKEAPATAASSAAVTALPPLVYQRKGAAWESFKCSCGRAIQLSPSFIGSSLRCRTCNRLIDIAGAPRPQAATSDAGAPSA